MDKTLLESVLGKHIGVLNESQQQAILESIYSKATDIASEKIEEVEKRYASQFSAMTESVSATLVDMADGAFKRAAEVAVKEDSVTYLMESVNKIRSILEDIGVVVGGNGGDIDVRMAKAEEKYQKGLQLLKKAKDLVDRNKEGVNKLQVENYIRKSMTGFERSIVEQAVTNFGNEHIDDIEDVLAQWLDNEDYTAPSAPVEKTLDIDGIDEDGIEKDLEELGNMVNKSIFESESNPREVKKPVEKNKLDKIRGLRSVTSPHGFMSDVSSTQLEALNGNGGGDSLFDGEDEHQILSTDVDVALQQINNFGKTWKL